MLSFLQIYIAIGYLYLSKRHQTSLFIHPPLTATAPVGLARKIEAPPSLSRASLCFFSDKKIRISSLMAKYLSNNISPLLPGKSFNLDNCNSSSILHPFWPFFVSTSLNSYLDNFRHFLSPPLSSSSWSNSVFGTPSVLFLRVSNFIISTSKRQFLLGKIFWITTPALSIFSLLPTCSTLAQTHLTNPNWHSTSIHHIGDPLSPHLLISTALLPLNHGHNVEDLLLIISTTSTSNFPPTQQKSLLFGTTTFSLPPWFKLRSLHKYGTFNKIFPGFTSFSAPCTTPLFNLSTLGSISEQISPSSSGFSTSRIQTTAWLPSSLFSHQLLASCLIHWYTHALTQFRPSPSHSLPWTFHIVLVSASCSNLSFSQRRHNGIFWIGFEIQLLSPFHYCDSGSFPIQCRHFYPQSLGTVLFPNVNILNLQIQVLLEISTLFHSLAGPPLWQITSTIFLINLNGLFSRLLQSLPFPSYTVHYHSLDTTAAVDGQYMAKMRAVSLLFGTLFFIKLFTFSGSHNSQNSHHWGLFSLTSGHFHLGILSSVISTVTLSPKFTKQMENMNKKQGGFYSSLNTELSSDDEHVAGIIQIDPSKPLPASEWVQLLEKPLVAHLPGYRSSLHPNNDISWEHSYETTFMKEPMDPRFSGTESVYLNQAELEIFQSYNKPVALATSNSDTKRSKRSASHDSPYDVPSAGFSPAPLRPQWVPDTWQSQEFSDQLWALLTNIYRLIPMEYQPTDKVGKTTSYDALLERLCRDIPSLRTLFNSFSRTLQHDQTLASAWFWKMYVGIFDRFNLWQQTKRQQSWRTFNPSQKELILPSIPELLQTAEYLQPDGDPVHRIIAASLAQHWRISQNDNVKPSALDINSLWRDFHGNLFCRAIFMQIGVYDIDLTTPAFAPWLIRLYLAIRKQAFDCAQAASQDAQHHHGLPRNPCTETELVEATLRILPPLFYVPPFLHGMRVLDNLYKYDYGIVDLFRASGVDEGSGKLPAMQSFGDRMARSINSRHKVHCRANPGAVPVPLEVASHFAHDGILADPGLQLRDAVHEAMIRMHMIIPTGDITMVDFLGELMNRSHICHHIFLSLGLPDTIKAGPQHPGYSRLNDWTCKLMQDYIEFQQDLPPPSPYRLPCCPLLVLEVSQSSTASRQLVLPQSLLNAPKPMDASLADTRDVTGPSISSHPSPTLALAGNSGSKFFHGAHGMHTLMAAVEEPRHSTASETSHSHLSLQWQKSAPAPTSVPPSVNRRAQKPATQGSQRAAKDLCAPHDSSRDLSKLNAAKAQEEQTQQLTQIHVPPLPPDITLLADSANQSDSSILPPLRVEVYMSALLKDIATEATDPTSSLATIVGQHASARVTFTREVLQVRSPGAPRQSSAHPFAWIRWAAELLDADNPDGSPFSLFSIFRTATTVWDPQAIAGATRICQGALQRLREHVIHADGQQVAYVALNEGNILVQHLQAFLQCLATNNQDDPWLGQPNGSPLGAKAILYGPGVQLDMLRIFLASFTGGSVHLAYKARYGERLVLLPLAPTRQAGDDLLYGHRHDLARPNHCTLAEATRMQGHLVVFESLEAVYLHKDVCLRQSQFYPQLQAALEYVLNATQYQHPPTLLASPHITPLASQLPTQLDWNIPTAALTAVVCALPYTGQASASVNLDPSIWLDTLCQGDQANLLSSLQYVQVQTRLISKYGPSAAWISGYNPPQSYGSLQGVGQHLDLNLDPNLYLGTSVHIDQVGVNPATAEPNIYLRLYRHASTATTTMLLQPGSALLAANIIRHFLGTGGDRLTNSNIGLPPATPSIASRRSLTDTVNLLLQRGAVTQEAHERIITSLNTAGTPLPSMGSNYQQQVQHLFDFYLALMSSAGKRDLGDLNAVVLLTLNTPGCTAPMVLAATHLDGPKREVHTEVFPLRKEATSRPHAKLLDISATFTVEGAFAVKVTYDNISLAAPLIEKATPVFPKSEVSSPHLPLSPEAHHPTPAPISGDHMAVVTPVLTPSQDGHTVLVIPHQAPKIAHVVMISGIRHSLDPNQSDTHPTSLLCQLCNGLMAAGYYAYLAQTDGSPVEGIRAALLAARLAHPMNGDPNNFHSYEVALPLVAPLSVGGTTPRPNLLTWCHNSKVPWERTPYTLQGLTQDEATLYNQRWEMLVTREGIPGESNCDAYGRDTFHNIIQGLLPPDEPLLTLVQWVGGVHYRKQNKGKGRVQTSGPIQVAYFNPRCLQGVLDNIARAVQTPNQAAGPKWSSHLKNLYSTHSVTDHILSVRNPALCHFLEFTFDIYTSSAISNFPVAPYGSACHVQPNTYYAIIKVPPHLSSSDLLEYYGTPGTLSAEFTSIRNWPQHPYFGEGISVMLNTLPNRTCSCILAVLNKVPTLNRLPYRDTSLFQTVHMVHPAREADRYHTTLGSLLHTVETTPTDSLLPDDMLRKYGLASPPRKGQSTTTTSRSSTTEQARTYRQVLSTADDSSEASSVVTRHLSTPSTLSTQTTVVTAEQLQVRELMMQQNARIDRLTDLVSMLITNQLGSTGGATAQPPPPPPHK